METTLSSSLSFMIHNSLNNIPTILYVLRAVKEIQSLQ